MTTLSDPPAEEGYAGPARLVHGPEGSPVDLPVEVVLRGVFQPLDGRYHWYGRVGRDDGVDRLVEQLAAGGAAVRLVTAVGEAPARLGDRDPWGRYRVTGAGRPPFRCDADREPGRGL